MRRLVADFHHCWSDCVSDGMAMQSAIAAWAALVTQAPGGGTPPTQTGAIETPALSLAQGIEDTGQERYAEDLLAQGLRLHPYFQSAYSSGGFTLGAGYRRSVSPYNSVDVRGSYTLKGYKRVEAEFVAPRFLKRGVLLSVLGGWREATLDIGPVRFLLGPVLGAGIDFLIVAWLVFWFSKKVLKEDVVGKK